MVTELHVRLAATAQRLIEKHGRDVTLYRQERTPGVAIKPWRGVPASVAPESVMGPIKVAVVPVSGSGFGHLIANKPGELTKEIAQMALLAADSIADLTTVPAELDPRRYDTLVDGAHAYQIVSVGMLKPGDTILLYVLALQS